MQTLSAIILVASAIVASALDVEHLATAIFWAEGGHRTRYPYGIKCHKHSPEVARRMCIRTIRNAHADWIIDGKPGDFVDYLASTYCPKISDPIGNRNWTINVRKLLRRQH